MDLIQFQFQQEMVNYVRREEKYGKLWMNKIFSVQTAVFQFN